MNKSIHSHTPQLAVIDNRGLPVRQVAYWRRVASELRPEALATAQEHDGAGRLVAQRDPRFLAPASRPNMATVYSLSGTALCTESRDAGWRLGLPDKTGNMCEHWDGRGSHWQNEYDAQRRLTAVLEQTRGSTLRTVERLTYADNTGEFAERNQCGQLIRHDDRAGVVWLDQQALNGGVIRQRRRFLPDQSDVHPHWPVVEAERDALLQPGAGYITASRFGPAGQVLEQTDAGGHRQHFSVDRAGQLQRIDLSLESQGRQPLLKSASYNAEGQLLTQVTGNDVTSSATYEAASGRLKRSTATTSACARLQDLRYEYDPVGNILRIVDHTQPVTFFANQRVAAENTYTYDTRYQLTCATGRETANAGQNPGLPELITPSPIDPGRLLNYTEFYVYDASGNRTELRHVSDGNPFRQQLRVDPQSNRALPWNEGEDEPDFPGNFDANGNQQYLAPGAQPMTWDALNQLQSVTTVGRPTEADDAEGYRYNAAGERVAKFSTQQAHAVAHRRVVHYLPGLEVRTTDDDEELHVICVPLARGSVRCLHWIKGKPGDIEADQLRYSVDDHLGSCSLELDKHAGVISHEGYYPYGGTAWWAARSKVDADYKTIRYSGKERDACGLYYYGFRYFAPWLGRWVNPDPAGHVDGVNVYRMVRNNPLRYVDTLGQMAEEPPLPANLDFEGMSDEQRRNLRRFLNAKHDLENLADTNPNSLLNDSKHWMQRFLATSAKTKLTSGGGALGGTLGGLIGGLLNETTDPDGGSAGGGVTAAAVGTAVGGIIGGVIGNMAARFILRTYNLTIMGRVNKDLESNTATSQENIELSTINRNTEQLQRLEVEISRIRELLEGPDDEFQDATQDSELPESIINAITQAVNSPALILAIDENLTDVEPHETLDYQEPERQNQPVSENSEQATYWSGFMNFFRRTPATS
ncbi:RHS repeat domain-containing protein [Pseudomonas sp. PDM03]|uniref:RHS repeat domain-containing protein n=1 Tax=Pseudomonas sp. PDM03 TaxID=2769266 RepID=UPI001CE196DA|nr:RHS repeat-associated core domain-containing protein [Pseudomonas sp. PDM03]